MSHLATQPLLELLRPLPGWRTDRAILGAYSAEPAVLVSILLALAGRDDDKGSGAKVALARAMTELGGRVHFVLQRGRLAAPRRATGVLALLDRFVCEVPWNEVADGEAGRSWHAKLALIRTVPRDGPPGVARWRLWLGSRNFTQDTSWDIALSLETAGARAGGQTLPGVDRLAARLAAKAGKTRAWRPLASELAEARWEVPKGLTARRVELMLPGDVGRRMPEPPPQMERLFAVAPFLDGQTVRRLGTWVDRRELLSSVPELAQLNAQTSAPLDGFELLALPGAPEDGSAPPEDGDATPEAALEARGLHAKVLWAEHGGRATLWLGSPNLTRRAWRRNAEAYAEIGVDFRRNSPAATTLRGGIEAFRELARPVLPEELGPAVGEDPVEEALEKARGQVAARLSGRQRRGTNSTIVETLDGPPHPDDPIIGLEVARLGEALRPWPAGASSIELPLQDRAETELLSLRVSLDERRISWTQLVPFDPPLSADRDTEVLGDYLGASGILDWISDELDDTVGSDGGGPWDAEPAPRAGSGGGATGQRDLPTVEKVLRAWTRDPGRLDAVDRILRGTHPTGSGENEAAARSHLTAFARSWKVLRAGLPGRKPNAA